MLNVVRGVSILPKSEQIKNSSHRSTKSEGRNRKLNALVSLEAIDTASGKEIRRFLFAAQDLEQNRDGRRLEGHPVYGKRPSVLIRLKSVK